MIENYNNLPWHDSELEEIWIDRQNSGTIRIRIRWPEEYGDNSVIMEYFDCYGLQMDMNFGIDPPGNILHAECIINSKELDKIKENWKK